LKSYNEEKESKVNPKLNIGNPNNEETSLLKRNLEMIIIELVLILQPLPVLSWYKNLEGKNLEVKSPAMEKRSNNNQILDPPSFDMKTYILELEAN